MTAEDRDLMERYLYQVVKRLPVSQRQEATMELRELMEDMLAEEGSMETVLTRLGDPAVFAVQYAGGQRHLIGPEYFDNYSWLLRVVLLSALLPVSVVSVVEGIRTAVESPSGAVIRGIIAAITNLFSNGILTGLSAFGAVTLAFALMERRQVKLDLGRKSWSPADLLRQEIPVTENLRRPWHPGLLEPVPDKRIRISRGESAVSIVFLIIFCLLLVLAPHFFSLILPGEDGVTLVPVFNLEKWPMILPLFAASLLIGLADEVVRLVKGCYCRAVLISGAVTSGLQLVLAVLLLKVLPFWNPNFQAEFQLAMENRLPGSEGLLDRLHWNPEMMSDLFLLVIVGVTLLELGTTVYKTLRYSWKGEL